MAPKTARTRLDTATAPGSPARSCSGQIATTAANIPLLTGGHRNDHRQAAWRPRASGPLATGKQPAGQQPAGKQPAGKQRADHGARDSSMAAVSGSVRTHQGLR
ncbi:hypothetical protein Acsp02_87890 [Actinoplanes sp. NBRC 103695]|nr:hypothetical protein Acsp02_87890 [Actinoplanes sp. NBRC 103695]